MIGSSGDLRILLRNAKATGNGAVPTGLGFQPTLSQHLRAGLSLFRPSGPGFLLTLKTRLNAKATTRCLGGLVPSLNLLYFMELHAPVQDHLGLLEIHDPNTGGIERGARNLVSCIDGLGLRN